ncbi:hypothetical protein [Pedobacter terrae]|uniref:hypothetical protein n=1 Tax=Pedobacter terrae TaxID=405671 RepID=UPI002FF8BCC4
MDKRLADIKNKVDASSQAFFLHLDKIFEDEVKIPLNELQHYTKVYLFSGLIRNYFLKVEEYRDIDIVLEKALDIDYFFGDRKITKNSFGGFKIFFNQSAMDLWFMENTWAFKNSHNTLNFQIRENIPRTAFFNFSSIVYLINWKKFYYTEHFLRFLKYRELDYVEPANANYGLCVVNTFYYADKYKLKITKRLMELILKFHNSNRFDYDAIQTKHFGEVLYQYAELEKRLSQPEKIKTVHLVGGFGLDKWK